MSIYVRGIVCTCDNRFIQTGENGQLTIMTKQYVISGTHGFINGFGNILVNKINSSIYNCMNS